MKILEVLEFIKTFQCFALTVFSVIVVDGDQNVAHFSLFANRETLRMHVVEKLSILFTDRNVSCCDAIQNRFDLKLASEPFFKERQIKISLFQRQKKLLFILKTGSNLTQRSLDLPIRHHDSLVLV